MKVLKQDFVTWPLYQTEQQDYNKLILDFNGANFQMICS